MKKLSKRLLAAILLLSFLTGYSYGQDKTDLNLSKNIILKSESAEQKVPVTVTAKCTSVNFRVSAEIQEGGLTIEIYDPKGEKQGNFSISCQPGISKTELVNDQSEITPDSVSKRASTTTSSSSMSSSSSSASSSSKSWSVSSSKESSSSNANGQINRSVKNPVSGNWIIKIIPKNASGKVKIDSEQETQEDSKK
jgi:hypothetical protein